MKTMKVLISKTVRFYSVTVYDDGHAVVENRITGVLLYVREGKWTRAVMKSTCLNSAKASHFAANCKRHGVSVPDIIQDVAVQGGYAVYMPYLRRWA